MAELALFRHGEELLRVPLRDQTSIGRDAACDVSLPDATLSRVQAVIERRGDAYWLLDHSRSGAAAGASAGPPALLVDGAEVTLGTWRALFRAGSSDQHGGAAAAGATTVRAVSAGGPPPARLRIRERGRERVFDLCDAISVSIGKDDGNDITLEDAFVSARHLRIERRGAGWRVRDLGSTNGTWLAGVRVGEADLPVGAAIALGDSAVALEPMTTRVAEVPAYERMISADPSRDDIPSERRTQAKPDLLITSATASNRSGCRGTIINLALLPG